MLPELPLVTASASGVNELVGPEEIVSLPIWAAAPTTRSFALVVASFEAFEGLARMFRAAEAAYGAVKAEEVARLGGVSRLKAKKILDALLRSFLRNKAHFP